MLILSVESSCDETAVAITRDGREILSDKVASQVEMHALYGGVVPEIASRRHAEAIEGLYREAIREAGIQPCEIDAIAATFAPGLIGALLVGLNFAKGLAFSLGKPLIPVHHHRGHVAANYLVHPELEPPFCALVASGGHTLILGVDGYTSCRVLGCTRDDSAGEAFDKVARVMGLGYPGGVEIDRIAEGCDETAYKLPRARVSGSPHDMSFSGLKTAMINIVHNAEQKGEELRLGDLAASFRRAVVDEIVPRVIDCAECEGYKTVVLAGGVAANARLRETITDAASKHGLKLYLPPKKLCGDAAAMIGAQGYYEFLAGNVGDMSQNAYASLAADYTALPER